LQSNSYRPPSIFYIEGWVGIRKQQMDTYKKEIFDIADSAITGELDEILECYYDNKQVDVIIAINKYFDDNVLCHECHNFDNIREMVGAEKSPHFSEDNCESEEGLELYCAIDSKLPYNNDAAEQLSPPIGRLFNIVICYIQTDPNDMRSLKWYIIRQEYDEDSGINFYGRDTYIAIDYPCADYVNVRKFLAAWLKLCSAEYDSECRCPMLKNANK
jgi:hypothetical protein